MIELISILSVSLVILITLTITSLGKRETIALETRVYRPSADIQVKEEKKLNYFEKLSLDLYQSRSGINITTYLLIALVAAVIFYVLTVFFVESKIIGIIAAVFGGFIPGQVVGLLKEVRRKQFDSQFIECLKAMSSSLRAGSTLLQAVEDVQRMITMPEIIRTELSMVLLDYEYRIPLEIAFGNMYKRTGADDVKSLALSIEISNKQGSKLHESIDSYITAIYSRKQMEADAQVALASTKSSVNILVAAPFIFSAIIKVASPDYFTEAFNYMNGLGRYLFFCLYAIIIAGYFVIKKMCNIRI